MKIRESETLIVGSWVTSQDGIKGDSNVKRIEHLATQYLSKIKDDESGWFQLFRDEADGRLWELSYPDGHIPGGGAPILKCIGNEEALERYGVV